MKFKKHKVEREDASDKRWRKCPECGAKVYRKGLWGWLTAFWAPNREVRCIACGQLGCEECCDIVRKHIAMGPSAIGGTAILLWAHRRCQTKRNDDQQSSQT